MADWESVVGPATLFFSIVAIVGLVMYYRTEKAKVLASSGGEYRQLAEEALRGQRVLLEEMRAMNQSLREIEKLLREV